MRDYADDHFELELPEMEAQHGYLYSLFDLIEQNTAVSNPEAMRALLTEIEQYIMFHFDSEEHLMRAYGFPGFAAHQTDHEAAGNKIVAFLDDFEAGALNPAKLRIFLTGWLLEHSKLSDSEYVTWIQERRQAMRAMVATENN